MATSQNGYPVFTSSTDPGLVAIPDVAGRVRRGDVAEVFMYLIERFDREVEDVDEARGQPQDDWGYAFRPIRGQSTGYSNHSSATAVDLNATRHPIGRRGTFSAKQVNAIHNILNDLDGVIRWGGDYSGRPDEMHFEINRPLPAVAAVVKKIRSQGKDWFDMATQKDLENAVAKGNAPLIDRLDKIIKQNSKELQRDKNVKARDTKRYKSIMAAVGDVSAETEKKIVAALEDNS